MPTTATVGQVVSEAVARLLSRKLLGQRWATDASMGRLRHLRHCANLWRQRRGGGRRRGGRHGAARARGLPVAPPPPGLLDAWLARRRGDAVVAGERRCASSAAAARRAALVELPANGSVLAQLVEARRLLGGPPLLPRLRDLGWFLGVREAIAARFAPRRSPTEFATRRSPRSRHASCCRSRSRSTPTAPRRAARCSPSASCSPTTCWPAARSASSSSDARARSPSPSRGSRGADPQVDLLTQRLAEACAEPFVLGFGLKLRLRANLGHKMQHIMNVVEAGDSEHRLRTRASASATGSSFATRRTSAVRSRSRRRCGCSGAGGRRSSAPRAAARRGAAAGGEGAQSAGLGALRRPERALAEDRLPLLCAGAAKLGLDLSKLRSSSRCSTTSRRRCPSASTS